MNGSRLRETRELKGLTQSELSERANLGEKEIWRYENGKSTPSADTVAQIARVLEVSTDFLLGLVDDPDPDLSSSDLRPVERAAISAWRRGDKLEAIKAIVGE